MENTHADWIHLTKIRFPCIVGMNEDELRTPQTLELELAIGLDLEPAAGGDLAQSVHYVAALDQVQFVAEEGRWRLLESLGAAIAKHLLRPPAESEGRAAIDRVKVRVGKPGYLKGRAQPRVELVRERTDVPPGPPAAAPGATTTHVVQLTRQSSAYHVDFGRDATFQVPSGQRAFVLGGPLRGAGMRELGRGAILRGGEVASSAASGGRLLLVGQPHG